ncbi:MAG: 1-(5-phosphoribosyl)-5-[(5-phosphoribosylamino)methylideneamino]imidazole-4-carboxamide isomerase [Intestinibacter bartlettii]|uniref:1-(5-phosphoribosyl)-5-[(5- phosphoribosylamino)methylideneamino]imidazole-4- carboxamide isomerase n=1 Tax=Intestinibacter bartlettii TaxID=261299 RepID=UPI0006649151|nr:1-(5-phosphoribosyl)-5-[(5-phosphoribosylamino)methylideneamino]imidazole-4-carboxamide isomerase [uncultured Intestinibacter sp.]KMW25131.1 phosphoribosylformimino-5-aminoimidazole carboxamide ribotide isomerase HisA [Clostridium sp. 1_1_41A1FAA]MDU4256561.1 1-(5-phosphoribosyl)-5-[(5-phosphoribosylamino)methylideneamino]imidazole-4-carboxamide isomerase [Intestinibacter bartlettii]MDU5919306.1 1-(5-phosphoribosyl)-5-[(5-phosphoribosylamino)methylideneamino]imidazole-4-carboxamide isomerase 
MIIFPAIDIKDKKCVRLTQGDFDKVNVYGEDPSLMAKKWADYGAEFIHVVNLNGSRDEIGINDETLAKVAKSVDVPIQVGGGIRDEKRVKELLDLGINRVIVGTMAIENKELLKELIEKYKAEKIVVSIDAKNGKVATHGWEKVSDIDSVDLCKELEQIGVKTIVYTDISKDGMLEGPNFDIYKELSQKTSLDIIASGGVTSIDDVKRLLDMNMYGAIIGKALYDNRIDLKEVLDLC